MESTLILQTTSYGIRADPVRKIFPNLLLYNTVMTMAATVIFTQAHILSRNQLYLIDVSCHNEKFFTSTTVASTLVGKAHRQSPGTSLTIHRSLQDLLTFDCLKISLDNNPNLSLKL